MGPSLLVLRWWPALLAVSCVACVACVPEGIRYPNPGDDAGPASDAVAPTRDAEPEKDATPGEDAQPGADGGPTGELAVLANGAPIARGATFDFGPIGVGGDRTVSFSIENGTSEAVSLTGSPLVAVSGASEFSAVQPSSAEIAAGASASFSIVAAPLAEGDATATVEIAYEGGGSYSFSISVTGRPPGVWVGVGNDGRRVLSLDGLSWSNEMTFGGSEDSNLFRGVGYGNGVFVACGGGQNGLLWWSDNGIDWNDVSDTSGWFGGVAFGNGLFIAVGANGRFLTSTNGRNWGSGDVDFEQHFRAATFGNGEFVLVGDGGRRTTTTDGVAFTPSVLGGDRLTAVVFTGDRFIAVGLSGRSVVSFDGETWMYDQNSGGGLGFYDVAYGDGIAIAVGGSGNWVSTDGGETWVQYTDAPLMNAVTFGNGQFVGAGDFSGVAFTSDDGISWTRHDSAGPAGFFTKIAYGE